VSPHKRHVLGLSIAGFLLVSLALCLPGSQVTAGSAAPARGAELFATKGCAHCHGAGGVSGGIGPDLQLVRKRMSAASIATQIHDGGKAMPAFGDSLSPHEIDDLVAYLREKRKLIAVPAAPAPPATNTPPSDPPTN
jgi:mono/diheme cytochrome c family protein